MGTHEQVANSNVSSASRSSSTTISADAYELLQCFSGKFDDVMYDIAEEEASKRLQLEGQPSLPVTIEVKDVEAAAHRVVAILSSGGNLRGGYR